jgi:hypothetical protein
LTETLSAKAGKVNRCNRNRIIGRHNTVVATVATFAGAKTIGVDPVTHNAYLFQPERGPVPAPPAGAPSSSVGPGGRGRGPQGPIVAAWFIVIKP